MPPLPESRFSPLQDFQLAWRWTDPRWAVLPPDVLDEIRPFTAQAAAELGRDATSRCDESTLHASSRRTTNTAGDSAAVAGWLATLPVAAAAEILVSWQDHLAVQTRWSIFARYWNDFCYPSSDDVTIWSPDARWTLWYHHDEAFHFRTHPPS